jgi:hypothetical protein
MRDGLEDVRAFVATLSSFFHVEEADILGAVEYFLSSCKHHDTVTITYSGELGMRIEIDGREVIGFETTKLRPLFRMFLARIAAVGGASPYGGQYTLAPVGPAERPVLIAFANTCSHQYVASTY